MKKILKAAILLTAVILLCVSLFACAGENNGPEIQYDKKYVSGNAFYVFSSDGTGYYETHSVQKDYTLSAKVAFCWEIASDNMVYLFGTDTTYFEDHTEGKNVSLINYPLAFGKDFFTYTYVSGTSFSGTSTYCKCYIVEDSDLKNAITSKPKS